jgi:hypothetical protein
MIMNARRLVLAAGTSGFVLTLMAAGVGVAHADSQVELHLRTPYPSVKCFTLHDEKSGSKKIVGNLNRQLPVGTYWTTGAWESASHANVDQTIVYYSNSNCTGSRGLIFFNPHKDGQQIGDHYNVDLVGKPLQPCGTRGQSCP